MKIPFLTLSLTKGIVHFLALLLLLIFLNNLSSVAVLEFPELLEPLELLEIRHEVSILLVREVGVSDGLSIQVFQPNEVVIVLLGVLLQLPGVSPIDGLSLRIAVEALVQAEVLGSDRALLCAPGASGTALDWFRGLVVLGFLYFFGFVGFNMEFNPYFLPLELQRFNFDHFLSVFNRLVDHVAESFRAACDPIFDNVGILNITILGE